MFKSEGCSVPFRSGKGSHNLKQTAESMNTVTFKANNLQSFIPFTAKDERESPAAAWNSG